MASWSEFKSWVESNHTIKDHSEGAISMMFGMPDGRSQLVSIVLRPAPDGAEYADVFSAFGEAGRVDLDKATQEIMKMPAGAIASTDKYVGVRHSVRLATLDADEFEQPLQMVVIAADLLEQALTGGDDF